MRLAAYTLAVVTGVAAAAPVRAQGPADRLQLRFDPSEEEAALAIVAMHQAGRPVADSDWQRLFATEPYQRLKRRETALHSPYALSDSEFKLFVLDSVAAHAPALRQTLDAWKRADLTAAASRAFAYLPAAARIRAKVFPVIKPGINSFVYETRADPTIFLYLNPDVPGPKFENTVAHELHHIGYATVSARGDSAIAALPSDAHAAAEWVGAFGEGFAMLAAAGGPDVHPHAVSSAADRARWDHDLANFDRDLAAVQQFLLDIVNGKLKTEEARDSVGYSFFGVQGPWYTVGWKMAVTIERRFGRTRLIDCMLEPRTVLAVYNQAAAEQIAAGGARLPLWSPELLRSLGVSESR